MDAVAHLVLTSSEILLKVALTVFLGFLAILSLRKAHEDAWAIPRAILAVLLAVMWGVWASLSIVELLR